MALDRDGGPTPARPSATEHAPILNNLPGDPMSVLTFGLAFFLLATFAAALVASLVGFAFGLVAAAVWLHILTPLQTAILIIAFGLLVQGYAVWKLRRALRWSRLWPFLLGGAAGVPLGVAILAYVRPDHM